MSQVVIAEKFSDIFGIYEVPNSELAELIRLGHRAMVNTAAEQSGGMQTGMTEHAILRQRTWITSIEAVLNSVYSTPIPDLPKTHNMKFRVNCEEMPSWTLMDDGDRVVNPFVQKITEAWATFWFELVGCDSAGLAGGMHVFDYNRAFNNLQAIAQNVDTAEAFQPVDFPETANPEARQVAGGAGSREPVGGTRTVRRIERGKK